MVTVGRVIATHHWDDWSLEDLLVAKGDSRVSLVVPARNEAATVGAVVTRTPWRCSTRSW
jgi:glucosyl-3-phosphoglycerate synthase